MRSPFVAVSFFLSLPVAWLSPVSSEEEPVLTALITGDGVNCRAGPGLSYEVIHQFPKRTKVSVLERRAGWYAVAVPPDVPVYVSGAHLRRGPDGMAVVDADRLLVRAGPGTAFTSFGALSREQTVKVRKVVREWAQIEPPSFCRGWVSGDYVVELGVQEEGEDPVNGNDRSLPPTGAESRPDSGGEAAS